MMNYKYPQWLVNTLHILAGIAIGFLISNFI